MIMVYKTTTVCQICGKSFYGGTEYLYCPACERAKKLDTVIRTRTCQVCGSGFLGEPDEKRCPKCAFEALREAKEYRKHGFVRPPGNTDKCIVCGKKYMFRTGLLQEMKPIQDYLYSKEEMDNGKIYLDNSFYRQRHGMRQV